MDHEINSLCSQLNYTQVYWKPKREFINDIDLFIDELKNYDNFNVDIYEILVSCGSNLNWSQEYYISFDDINWFKSDIGKQYFIENINNKVRSLNNSINYSLVFDIYNKLCDLFELQVAD